MQVQAINNCNSTVSCQPIKPNFKGEKILEEMPQQDCFCKEQPLPEKNDYDKFESQKDSEETLQEKYDLACRVAAYYKTKYENLKQGSCVA